MNGKRHTPEQIIHKLRQAEVELGQGATVPQVCNKIGVTEQTSSCPITHPLARVRSGRPGY